MWFQVLFEIMLMCEATVAALFSAPIWFAHHMAWLMLQELAFEMENHFTVFAFKLSMCNLYAPWVLKNHWQLLHCSFQWLSLKCWFRACTLLQWVLHLIHWKVCFLFHLDLDFDVLWVPLPSFLRKKLLVTSVPWGGFLFLCLRLFPDNFGVSFS